MILKLFHYNKKFGFKLLILNILCKLIFALIRFLNKQRLAKTPIQVIKQIQGSKMLLDRVMDDGVCRFLSLWQIRESYITEVLKKELQAGDIVIDIGANIGYYALLESRLVGKRGKVYAIEPAPQSVELLKENMQLNNYFNMEIHQVAMGDKTGIHPMYVCKWLNRSQMKRDKIYKEDLIHSEIDVPISTLDDFLGHNSKSHPDIIRMDVEGYEYNIIKGMKKTLEKKLPLKIFMEFHFRLMGREKSVELLRMLKDAGFRIKVATYELDEKCISYSWFLRQLSSYLNSKFANLPRKGEFHLHIDELLYNDPSIWKREGAMDLALRFGSLEIFFERELDFKLNTKTMILSETYPSSYWILHILEPMFKKVKGKQ